MYTAFCDIFAGSNNGEPIYRGTLCLLSSLDEEQARIAGECWKDFPAVTLLVDFYSKEYVEAGVVTYIKKVA